MPKSGLSEQLLAVALLLFGIAVTSGNIRLLQPICMGATVLGACIGVPLDLNIFLGLAFIVFGLLAWWHSFKRSGKLIG